MCSINENKSYVVYFYIVQKGNFHNQEKNVFTHPDDTLSHIGYLTINNHIINVRFI